MVTFSSASGLPLPGALLVGLDEEGRQVATLAMIKRLAGQEGELGVAEVVTGDSRFIVILTWE